MVDDELPPNEDADPSIPPGPRRSTYTPPPGGIRYEPAPSAGDDADLTPAANAPATAGVPVPPQRRSLSDAELLAAADPATAGADSAALLDLVEQQLALRQAEAEQLIQWEAAVRAAEPDRADELVAPVRAEFRDVLPRTAASAAAAATAGASAAATAAAPAGATEGAAAAEPTLAERLASAPPPDRGAASSDFATPAIDLALADAPPPWGQVPSAVVPPPASPTSSDAPASPDSPDSPASPASPGSPASPDSPSSAGSPPEPPPLVEPAALGASPGSPALPPESALGVFDALLREPEPVAEEALGGSAGASSLDDLSLTEQDGPALLPAAAPPAAADADADAMTAGAAEGPEGMPEADPPADAAAAPVGPRATRLEVIALEPTPAEQRAGRAIRMFWLWFAVNSSVVSLALGGVVLGLGLSLRQAVLAALIGVALSFLPLGLGTLASRWSGQPTMVVSRSTFGTVGNALPALIALLTRLVWAAVLLWMLGTGTAEILVGSGLVTGLGRLELALIVAGAGLVLAAVVAGVGFGLIAVVSAIVSALSAVLVVGLIVLTLPYVDLAVALSVPDGDWLLMVAGAVIVFSAIGLAWAMSSGDVARYQARGTSGSATLLATAFGATLPAFALIAWGAVLAASNPLIAEGLQSNPLDVIARLLPVWYPAPLIAAVALSLLAAATLALYSGGFSMLALGVRGPRWVGVLLMVVKTGAVLALLLLLVPDTASLLRDTLTTVAVPVAAWVGIFGAETMIRSRRVHSPSLLRSGGVYPAVRWVNLLMLIVIIGVGWGATTAEVPGLTWQGYLLTPLGVPLDAPLAVADLGVLLALALGLLTPLIAGIPALRRLQSAEKAAAEAEALAETGLSA